MPSLPDTVAALFAASGPLSRLPQYEYRPQQQQMAVAIAETLEDGEHLIVEAPTGVGKTLAYLLPALLSAREHHRKAVISTHTKNLQEQILWKDMPLVRHVLGHDVPAMTLKGRRNYLCTGRLKNALTATESLFTPEGERELAAIHRWSLSTPDGDSERMGFLPRPDVWDMVCSLQGACSATICGHACFYQRARELARRSPMVIMNHALFFTLLTVQGTEERFIYDNDFVVFDEAHTLESVAGTGIGKSVSWRQVLFAIHRLYNPKTKRGLLASQKRNFKTLSAAAEREVGRFFDQVRTKATALQTRRMGLPTQGTRQVRIRSPLCTVAPPLDALGSLRERVQHFADNCGTAALGVELRAVQRSLAEAQNLIEELHEQRDPSFAYWVEFGDRTRSNVVLCASPPEPGELLGPMLFRPGVPLVMTSATLTVQNRMDYFQSRVGATEARSLILDSPFDHARHMRICVVRDIPEPESDAFLQELPGWVRRCIERTRGRALVLFTSATTMNTVAEALSPELADRGIRLFVQGEQHSRHELLESFKRDTESVLFGLESYWSGVDVPGESLEQVIITRLPFAVPVHPLIEARMEAITRRGGNTFMEYTLPEAVLKFRQGAGRLIRTATDRGIVTILDSRILRKSYGHAFISSLPPCPLEVMLPSGETLDISREDW